MLRHHCTDHTGLPETAVAGLSGLHVGPTPRTLSRVQGVSATQHLAVTWLNKGLIHRREGPLNTSNYSGKNGKITQTIVHMCFLLFLLSKISIENRKSTKEIWPSSLPFFFDVMNTVRIIAFTFHLNTKASWEKNEIPLENGEVKCVSTSPSNTNDLMKKERRKYQGLYRATLSACPLLRERDG